jgi:hypothetical protein
LIVTQQADEYPSTPTLLHADNGRSKCSEGRRRDSEEELSMTLPPLEPVADLAGHPLSEADLAEIASLLEGVMEDVQKLRDLDLHDDIEPILTFRVEPWT